MPIEWRSPRLRSLLLQAALLLILAGALALAASLSRARVVAGRIALGEVRQVGQLSLRLPVGWATAFPATGADEVEARRAAPADDPDAARRLVVRRRKVRPFLSPLQYLQRAKYLRAGVPIRASAAPVANWPGLVVRTEERVYPLNGPPQLLRTITAVTVLPSRDAIVVSLDARGPVDAADDALVRAVADSVRATDVVPPAPARGEVTLAGVNVTVRVPDRFITSPGDDPFRAGLQVIAEDAGAAAGWLGVEIVPCILPPGGGADAIESMLAARDWGQGVGEVRALGPRYWTRRLDGPDTSTTDYVLASDDGQALLVEIRADLNAAPRVEAVWEAIRKSVRFAVASDVPQRLARGAELARAAGPFAASLLTGDARAGSWEWQWTEHASALRQRSTYATWVHQDERLDGNDRTGLAGLDDAPVQLLRQWELRADLSQYQYTAILGDAASPAQVTTVAADQVKTTLRRAGGSPRELAAARPPQFVPGVLLPQVLSTVEGGPLVLRAESVLGAEGVVAAAPLVLLVEPATDFPRYADGSNTPMKCLAVQVSGTSEVARWYFAEDGRLRYVDLPAGLHVQLLDQHPPPSTAPATREAADVRPSTQPEGGR